MNVIQIVPELKSGGVERGTVDLARYLRRKGHKSIVVSAGGALVGDLTSAGVVHYTLPVQRKNPFHLIRSIKALNKIVRQERIDVIHARSRVPALIAYVVSRYTHVPFVTTCHGFYSDHFLSRIMGWGKIVIVASHIIGKRMREDFGVSHQKIHLIPRGVDLNEFQPASSATDVKPKKMVVGVIGRLTPIKGHPFFLKAMARVTRVMPQVSIQIIGDAPKPQYKEELMLLAKNLGLSSVTEFLGTRYDIAQLLSKMSVLVVPSVGEEAFGRVAIEAGACRIPVVATRIGGLVDIIEHEKDGLLTPPDDPRLLAESILRLLKDPTLASSLAESLRKKVEREFSLDDMFERTLKVYREAVEQKRILVIKLSAVGDVILSIPSLRAIRRKFPQARLSVLVSRKCRKIIRNCPYVDDTLVYEERTGQNAASPVGRSPVGAGRRIAEVLRMGKLLAKEDFDITVDLQNNKISHVLSFLSGARVRAGHDNRKWSFLLNQKTLAGSLTAAGPVDHQFQVLKLLGIETLDRKLEFWTDPEEESAMKDFLSSQWVAESQILVGVNLGSSLRWPTKQWPIENFAKLCDELAKRNIRVVLTGSKDDAPLAESLMSLTRNKPINAVGRTTITELGALIRRCKVFISSDSAPMHVASSVDVALLAIFGPTDPKRHLMPPSSYQVFWKEIPCSPCYLQSCPIGLICMKKITVQEILDATLHCIGEKRRSSSDAEYAQIPS